MSECVKLDIHMEGPCPNCGEQLRYSPPYDMNEELASMRLAQIERLRVALTDAHSQLVSGDTLQARLTLSAELGLGPSVSGEEPKP